MNLADVPKHSHSIVCGCSRIALLWIFLISTLGAHPNHGDPEHACSEQNQECNTEAWNPIIEACKDSPQQHRGAQFAAKYLDVDLFAKLSPKMQRQLLKYADTYREGRPPLTLCWGAGTPTEVIEAFHIIEEAGMIVRDGSNTDDSEFPVDTAFQADDSDRWFTTATNSGDQSAQGLPITLTWSIVPDGTIIPGGAVDGESTNDPSNLRAFLAGIYGGSATDPAANQPWFSVLQAAFDNIAAQTGLTFIYEPNDDGNTLSSGASGRGSLGVRGDIRIAGHKIDGNSNVLAYNYFPDFSEMVIDTDDSFYNNTNNNSIRLRNVVEHELGHGLGLSHVCPVNGTKLMEPFINLGFTGIQFDDIYTLQRLYGDFLEAHSSARNNDSITNATPISAPVGSPFTTQWLGIDDNTDVDFFSFDVPANSLLSISVTPSDFNYLEGEQTNSGCTAGTPFDASLLHNLEFTIIAPDQSTAIANIANTPLGESEEILNLPANTAGTYTLRVKGEDTANVNQLYRLDVEVSTPSLALQLTATAVIDELFQNQNQLPDPGETILLEVSLENLGLVDATNLTATLSGPAELQAFENSYDYGTLSASSTGNGDFTFALNGDCGDILNLQLQLTADGGYTASVPFQLLLGSEQNLLTENFDSSSSIPTGWSSQNVGSGTGWEVVTTEFNSAPNALFAPDIGSPGDSILVSPTLSIGSTAAQLSFNHFYDTELNWDGGVVEISLDNGMTWQDIISAGGAFIAGGYDSTLNESSSSIANRSAWSGNSGGFITTEIALPPSAINQDIQLRWIMGHDDFVSGLGWYLDDITLSAFSCDSSGPRLALSSTDTETSEFFNATDTANLILTAPLPTASNFTAVLNGTGSANVDTDFSGLTGITLTTGSTEATLEFTAISDGLVEGSEDVTITSPDATGSVLLTAADTPYGQWAASTLGTVGAVSPLEDFDLDGSLNIEELIYNTDATDSFIFPSLALMPDGTDTLKLPVPLGTLPIDVVVEAETTVDLQTWNTDGLTELTDGYQLNGFNPRRFIRLVYTVEDTAP